MLIVSKETEPGSFQEKHMLEQSPNFHLAPISLLNTIAIIFTVIMSILLFETESHVSQLDLNFSSSSLHLPSTGITGVPLHTQLMSTEDGAMSPALSVILVYNNMFLTFFESNSYSVCLIASLFLFFPLF